MADITDYEAMTDKDIAAAYQPLYDKLHEHGVILLVSELDEVIVAAQQVVKNINALNSEA